MADPDVDSPELPYGYYHLPEELGGIAGATGLAHEKHEAAIAEVLTSDERRDGVHAGVRAALRAVDSVRSRTRWAKATVLDGPEASVFLRACIEELERLAQARAAQSYGPHRWLWYLRRIPVELLGGRLGGTGYYRRTVAEVLACHGYNCASSTVPAQASAAYPLDRAAMRRIAWLVGFSQIVALLHVQFRLCGKGARVDTRRVLDARQSLPFDVQDAIDVYDQRAATSSLEAILGTAVLRKFEGVSSDKSAVLLFVPDGGNQLRTLRHPTDATRCQHVPPRYAPYLLDSAGLEVLLRTPRLQDPAFWNPDLGALLCLLKLGLLLVADSVESFANAVQVGYIVVARRTLSQHWTEFAPPIIRDIKQRFPPLSHYAPSDLDDILFRCASMRPCAWPPTGLAPVFDVSETHVGIDLVSATDRLFKSLSFPRVQGDVANIRGEIFEDNLQELIDGTRWAPPEAARSVREIPALRLAGRPIGDIDAIASDGKRTLLVSCKSILYTPEYDCGEYAAIRNAQDRIAESVGEWDVFLERLRQNPRGDNYDLTPFGQLIGVVVTPHIFFVRAPILFREAAVGLRYYSSAKELVDWLSQN